jgi:hypothetical protein
MLAMVQQMSGRQIAELILKGQCRQTAFRLIAGIHDASFIYLNQSSICLQLDNPSLRHCHEVFVALLVQVVHHRRGSLSQCVERRKV